MKSLVFFLLLLVSYPLFAVNEEGNQNPTYYCVKNGTKIISDKPCSAYGAKETARKTDSDYTPLNTKESPEGTREERLKQMEKERLARQEFYAEQEEQERIKKEREASERQRQVMEDRIKEGRCEDLRFKRNNIKARQRIHNTRDDRDRQRAVEEEMISLQCPEIKNF